MRTRQNAASDDGSDGSKKEGDRDRERETEIETEDHGMNMMAISHKQVPDRPGTALVHFPTRSGAVSTNFHDNLEDSGSSKSAGCR